jgi:hypothetical protein
VPTPEVTVAAYSINRCRCETGGASLRKPCFAETIDIHLTLPLTETGYPFRKAKIRFELEQTGRCLPRFRISPLSRFAAESAIYSLRWWCEEVCPWYSRFAEPIDLPSGVKVASLREAIVHILGRADRRFFMILPNVWSDRPFGSVR